MTQAGLKGRCYLKLKSVLLKVGYIEKWPKFAYLESKVPHLKLSYAGPSVVLSNHLIPSLRQFIWQCNLKYSDVHEIIKTDSFWHDVLLASCKCNFYDPEPSDIKHQIIWYNSHIKMDNKVVMWDRVVQYGYIKSPK